MFSYVFNTQKIQLKNKLKHLHTGSFERLQNGWDGLFCTDRNQVHVLDVAGAVSHHTEAPSAAKVGEQGHVGNHLFFSGGEEADHTEHLSNKWVESF